MEGFEQLILLILLFNIFIDAVGYFMILIERDTHTIYNVLLPLERSLTLLIYSFNEQGKLRVRMHQFGIVCVLLSFGAGMVYHPHLTEFNSLGNVLSGLVLAALSYIHLRSISLNTAGQSPTLFYFGLANLIYFTLMISAMSALPLAQKIDQVFASKIYAINLVSYALWALILIIGILWKKQRI